MRAHINCHQFYYSYAEARGAAPSSGIVAQFGSIDSQAVADFCEIRADPADGVFWLIRNRKDGKRIVWTLQRANDTLSFPP